MEEKQLERKILKLFSDHFGIPRQDLKLDLQLEKDLNATRLELTDFYSILENTFDIKIDPQDCENFKEVGDIVNFVIDHGSFI